MANVTSTQILADSDQNLVVKFTNISDGTDESAERKVIVANLNTHTKTELPCSSLKIQRLLYNVTGMAVDILWEATLDQVAWICSGAESKDFRQIGPLFHDTEGAGITGDVLFTTVNATDKDRYVILIDFSKHYTVPTITD